MARCSVFRWVGKPTIRCGVNPVSPVNGTSSFAYDT